MGNTYTELAFLTVIYHETDAHVQMARSMLSSLPEGIYKHALVNKIKDTSTLDPFDSVEYNDENCLAKAWNKGLTYLFNKGYKRVLVTGMDQIVDDKLVEDLYRFVNTYPEAGFWSATASNDLVNRKDKLASTPVEHGDSSFSCFIIDKETFGNLQFDENFTPAYFEDNDYLEQLRLAKYTPLRAININYFHVVQGTIKYGTEIQKEYPIFMQKNLDYFKKKWGKVPSHLPSDISF